MNGEACVMQAAIALIAVSLNLFPDDLYRRKGGKGRVKEGRYIFFEIYQFLKKWGLTDIFVKNHGAIPCRIPGRSGVMWKRPNSGCWQHMW